MAAVWALIKTWVTHNVARTIGVALVALVVVSIPYMIYSKGYNVGYSKGYAKAVADRPTYGTVGVVNNSTDSPFKFLGIRLNLWKLGVNLGI